MIKKKLMLSIVFAIVGFLFAVSTVQTAEAGQLYAGTSNPGIVYAYDGSSWTAISGSLGFAVLDLIEFQGDLYAATTSSLYSGEVYRYDGGTTWTLVCSSLDGQVCDLEVWNNDLYAGTAWNGGKLYRYNTGTDTFDYVGIVPDCDSGGYYHPWAGIRAMYSWAQTGDLHLGDIGYDCLGRYDGTTLIYDAFMDGSCIYDFAEFNGKLYAGAWMGRLLWSSTGVGLSWSDQYFSSIYDIIWELEPFQGYLYMGDDYGNLSRLDASHNHQIVWSSGSPYDKAICSMVTDGDSILYFGTGGEAGYNMYQYGTARICAYDGSSAPVEIFNGDNIGNIDHAGVQCLYLPPERFEKVITDGPDLDEDGEIDKVVEVGKPVPTEYEFTIYYTDSDWPEAVVILDTVPAEWEVISVTAENSDDDVDVSLAGQGNKSKSATKIVWRPASSSSSLTIVVQSRERGGSGKFSPTSCGALYLNDGAVAYEADPLTGKPLVDPETGELLPPIFGPTEPLRLAAVEDLDDPPDGVVGNGSGDEDGDSLSDWDEVYVLGTDPCTADTDGDGLSDWDELYVTETDPCNADSDGDGVLDGEDPAPLDPLIP